MILLLGGTSETAPLAEALADAGYEVLVSTATDVPLAVGNHPRIAHRSGRLTETEMTALVQEHAVSAIVDATHPYASNVRATAERVAAQTGTPYLTFVRPGGVGEEDGVRFAADHPEAARLSCEPHRPIFLTVGSRNIAVYAQEAARHGIPLVARVLPHPDSVQACLAAGLPDDRIVTGRGPFSVEENRRLMRQFNIGVIVTKDSGEAGGVPAKLEAARAEQCLLIVVERPPQLSANTFHDMHSLLQSLRQRLVPSFIALP
ncbi:MAG: precorrin-6A reductase, partial [Verrucomicrobia bacterium]|nr:precorrin-6A reductase [Verrucomicrobiota bacterium]